MAVQEIRFEGEAEMTRNVGTFSRIASAAAVFALIGLAAAGCGQQQAAGNASAAAPSTTTSTSTTTAPATVNLSWEVVNGGNAQHSTWPFFSQDGKNPFPATLTLPANTLVTVTIKNYDDGGGQVPAPYAKVTGTVGNTETVNGQQETSFKADGVIAHTFTVPGLNLNIPLPAAASASSPAVVVATFKTPAKAGTYTWQCYQPCGTGSAGWGGTMATAGWMTGSIQISN